MKHGKKSASTWRDYQKKLNKKKKGEYILSRMPWLALFTAVAVGFSAIVFLQDIWLRESSIEAGLGPEREAIDGGYSKKSSPVNGFSEVMAHLNKQKMPLIGNLEMDIGGSSYKVESTIMTDLQGYIKRLLENSLTMKAAVVALDPRDGRILAMVNHDADGRTENICLRAVFPAASLFKIVSASAAIEKAGFTPDSPVTYYGRKYTLYRSQLKKDIGKYISETTFKNAFASSINSVFGRIGIFELGQEVMADYADKFLFNRPIPFELPVEESVARIPGDEFGLAEIACGFNKKTMISPLHAALLAAAVANRGVIMTPRLIDRVTTESGETMYRKRPEVLASPLEKDTAEDMRILMRETTRYGTCRNFLKLLRKKSFKGVELGAKTGTINDSDNRYKYDWLTAYLLDRNGKKSICIAILGIHGKVLGVRANELGKLILEYYVRI